MTIIVKGHVGGVPTKRLSVALHHLRPASQGTNRADVLVIPRDTEPGTINPATHDAWYDLHFSHPAVIQNDHFDGGYLEIIDLPFMLIGPLEPPPRLPIEMRLATTPPATLDGWTAEQIKIMGGEGPALDYVQRQQLRDLTIDLSAAAYDWRTLAETLVRRVNAMSVPRLHSGQRAQVAAVRLLEAQRNIWAAEQAFTDQLRRAEQSGRDTSTIPAVMRPRDSTSLAQRLQIPVPETTRESI